MLKTKITNKDVEYYLIDCLGYDEIQIADLKDSFKPLKGALSDEEMLDCINYFM